MIVTIKSSIKRELQENRTPLHVPEQSFITCHVTCTLLKSSIYSITRADEATNSNAIDKQ